MEGTQGEVTTLLAEMRNGNRGAESRLMPLVYDELRKLARHYMRSERPDHTLQATALVHEAYLRLIGQREIDWHNRAHFFGVAAQSMRRILVDHARAHLAQKRGKGEQPISLDDACALDGGDAGELVALDEALARLATRDPRQSRIVELRFFGGLKEEEVAEVLGVSSRTVKREWRMARAWLYKEIQGQTPGRAVSPKA
jgi:RNA polymerase sigma-70 factor, ECF subfamily